MESKYYRGNRFEITEKGDNIMIIPTEPAKTYLPGFRDREFSYAFSRPQPTEVVREAFESMGDESDAAPKELLNGFMNQLKGVKIPMIAIKSRPLELNVLQSVNGGKQ